MPGGYCLLKMKGSPLLHAGHILAIPTNSLLWPDRLDPNLFRSQMKEIEQLEMNLVRENVINWLEYY